jgi:DNA-3-methyladenine glycosylase
MAIDYNQGFQHQVQDAIKLSLAFYQRKNVVRIARELLGKMLFTNAEGVITGGVIVETEAYSWRERGCHAFGSKLTPRTSVMFKPGGHAYVYLCYGVHHMFNIVTNVEGVPEAVLVRALEPCHGIPEMVRRRGKSVKFNHLTSGPGRLTKSMGIDRSFNGKILNDHEIWLQDARRVPGNKIVASRRVGIDYAGKDAQLPWRFSIKDNPWVSRA